MSVDDDPAGIPKVSVVMATYNCAGTVVDAIDSIVAQTYVSWELVICDDSSTDGTYELLLAMAERHADRIVLVRNDVNSKLPFSLNRCLQLARGELIARMDGDDISCPNRLYRQVNFLAEHPDVHLVGTAMRRFDDTGPADVVRLDESPDRFSLRHGVPFWHATILTYKYVYETLGNYTVSRRTSRTEDYDLWFRFYHHGFVGRNLSEPLYMVREDRDAVRRRTVVNRLRLFQTTLIGYSLLRYPARWYLSPALGLLKIFVPLRFMLLYRRFQKFRGRETFD